MAEVISTLLSKKEIGGYIKSIASSLDKEFRGEDSPLFLVLLNGGAFFGVDLTRAVSFDHHVTFAHIDSDGEKIRLVLKKGVKLEGRAVIVVDEFIDTGETIIDVCDILCQRKAKSITVATLLSRYNNSILESLRFNDRINSFHTGYIVKTPYWLIGYGLNKDNSVSDYRSKEEIFTIKEL